MHRGLRYWIASELGLLLRHGELPWPSYAVFAFVFLENEQLRFHLAGELGQPFLCAVPDSAEIFLGRGVCSFSETCFSDDNHRS
jgi:hypothetical protein